MATIKKAQKGATTPMQRLKAKYPSADTSARGDIRFSETYSSLPSRQRKESDATKKAFDQKYGKGKPAYRKGGTVKKSASKKGCMSCGGTMKKSSKRK